ncbi:hypothetical protein MCOR27_007117 [Pyricularia oryzae]|uniref:EF-hand domain-containing protein n=2 Tax=Pyricularia TaxID=48558 RepID=A0ABQ8N316_PYRGI|nr:hypothetical protein MCOR01_002483 [Pyricularia oryzae]KAI6290429.1 hypothetical protein MCOR33_011317 [Pyricularia grisea]KAH9428911.1 hypothetical protein MCOR02_010331 [Pyricularia oryzae]KAI6256741.1 hypothetical protein MCOR19_006798 [Pyricularia oryzae]KAI6266284.1 hypothetical protein MCOR26_010269 [Pyricularia oryzae]
MADPSRYPQQPPYLNVSEYSQGPEDSSKGQDGSQQQRGRQPSQAAPSGLAPSTYWDNSAHGVRSNEGTGEDFVDDPMALQFALPPDINPRRPSSTQQYPSSIYEPPQPYYNQRPQLHVHTDSIDSDRAPLATNAQPISGNLTPGHDGLNRDSFQTVRDMDTSRDNRMLGADLENGQQRNRSFGNSLMPDDGGFRRSRTNSTASGALSRTASMVRAMSQRVVNISGENEVLEQQARRRSRSPSAERRHFADAPIPVDTSYSSQMYPNQEKHPASPNLSEAPPPPTFQQFRRPQPMINPLKGKSLGIFGPENPIRKALCNILVLPWTEPLILLLIVAQAVLLAVEAAPTVEEGGRGDRFGSAIDWAVLGLFIVFTLEVIARIIVSGFILNAAEYSTIDRKRGIKVAVADKYKQVFQPTRQKSIRRPTQAEHYGPSTFARSITIMQGQAVPETIEEQQRMQLARRAFLRHGFNRLDFIAVVAFWISFGLSVTGLEKELHLWVFKMLSSLRIVRLLAITKGNAIILRSLKKSAPLLVRVSFLIGFFWLLFAIIGVQSFKGSLKRSCFWVNPEQTNNISAGFQNDDAQCGGWLDNTGTMKAWIRLPPNETGESGKLLSKPLFDFDVEGSPKGFICPRGSVCLEQDNPHNGTVNFDNILNSLELVFVVMSANTWSDLMYQMTNTDYLAAALYFAAAIVIMMLWMTNLLIAVITSSFQVIREESKASAFTADQDAYLMNEPGYPKRVSGLQKIYNKTWWIWPIIIAFDLIAMAWRSVRSSPERVQFIRTTELVVTILLVFEIIYRFAADWRDFHRRPRNLVDLFLAIATAVIQIPIIRDSGETYEWLTVFQILRAYRVVLAIPVTNKLIRLVLGGNASGIGNLLVFVFLMTFLMSIFAAQLFRGELPEQDEDGEDIKVNFGSIYNSFLGMYQVLTSEDWTDMLYSITGTSQQWGTAWIAGVFFIGWFILSYFILINMFIAVIQENFDVSEDQKRLEQVKAFLQRKELGSSSSLTFSRLFTLGKQPKKDPLDYGPAMMEMLLKEAVVKDFLDDPAVDPLQRAPTLRDNNLADGPIISGGKFSQLWQKAVAKMTSRDPNPFYSFTRFNGPNETLDPRKMARDAVQATAARRKAQREYLARHPTYNNSMWIFKPSNPIRRLCQRVVGPGRGSERFDGVEPNIYAWYIFSAFIYASILAMVVIACVTTPLYQKEYRDRKDFKISNWFVWTDMAFAAIFTTEAFIKVIADGFFFTPNAYFRSSWGLIDAVVLTTLWISVITVLKNEGSISRAVGAFKALRALRLLNVSDTARNTFHSLIIVQGWKILSAAFVSLSLLIPFALYGLNLFQGQFDECNDGNDITLLKDCWGEYMNAPIHDGHSILAPRAVNNPQYSFDDFGSSLFILYQIVSQERWVDVSFSAQAISGIGNQPIFGNQRGNGMFFVIFNILSTVFVLTLFISVFMRNYTEQTGVAYLTAEQRSWLELRKLLRQVSPSKTSYDESRTKWKKWCHKRAIEKRGKWYQTVTAVLCLHLALLITEFIDEPDVWSKAREFVFLAFNLVYLTNIAIRITGLGWTRFRRSSWDMFSLVSVSGTIVTSVLHLSDPAREVFTQLHKVFLVSILLLLIPRNGALDQLFKTAAASLTTIGNLVATWFVFYIMFAIALTQSFSLTRFGPEENNNQNFRTVPKALILLFRMSAGEGWNTIMEDYAEIEPPMCVESTNFLNSDCGSKSWARCLFIAWNIISMYIFVNLFVSLIYESFSYVYQRSSGVDMVDRDEIRRFKEAWRSIDPAGTGFISKEAFPRLLGELSGVFEMRIYDSEDSVSRILEDCQTNGAAVGRHASMVSQSAYSGVDLAKLNERLARLDVAKVRERRRRYNMFFEEVMVLADPDKGIAFSTVLMILAHYNIISDSKSLRLEEFLRRRARLQRVEEEVRRRVVLGFFDTLFWSRNFKRHLAWKRSGRMTDIPNLDVPEIFVDDEGGVSPRTRVHKSLPIPGTPSSPRSPFPAHNRDSPFLSPDHPSNHQRKWSAASADMASYSPELSGPHPLSFPRAGQAASGHQRNNPSAFSFDLQQPPGSNSSSRRGSTLSPTQARELLDDSVWVESIRRSTTVRQSAWGSRSGSYSPSGAGGGNSRGDGYF